MNCGLDTPLISSICYCDNCTHPEPSLCPYYSKHGTFTQVLPSLNTCVSFLTHSPCSVQNFTAAIVARSSVRNKKPKSGKTRPKQATFFLKTSRKLLKMNRSGNSGAKNMHCKSAEWAARCCERSSRM